jgi:hypothetical protein
MLSLKAWWKIQSVNIFQNANIFHNIHSVFIIFASDPDPTIQHTKIREFQ